MASNSTEFVRAQELNVTMTLDCQEQAPCACTADINGTERSWHSAISYFPDGQRMISASCDKSARLWDLQAGKEIKEAQVVCKQGIDIVAVSRNGRWVVTVAGNLGPWEVKARDMKTGVVKTFEGHSGSIYSIDISVDSKLLASRCSPDGTIWIWNLDSGKLMTGPFASSGSRYDMSAIRLSQDSKKLAVMGFKLEVWDIEKQKLGGRVESYNINGATMVPGVPIFWTTEDRTIVAAFNSSDDRKFNTIYEFDASTLETVGTPFKGHTDNIIGLTLSYDCTLLVSASSIIIKLWAFESRQLLASLNSNGFIPPTLILSPDARQIAYTVWDGAHNIKQIRICDIPHDILAKIPPTSQKPSIISPKNPHLHDPLNSVPTARRAVVRHNPVSASVITQSSRRSRTIQQEQLSILRHLRKLLPFSFHRDVQPVPYGPDPCDPLDCPATSMSHGPHNHSSTANDTAVVRSGHNERSRPTQARHIPKSSDFTSTPIRSHLSNWWHIHKAAPVVSVPFAQGKERNATAGAPKRRDDCRPDEDFDSRPSSPNSDSQRASASAQATSGEHGSGRLCFCL